MQDMSYTYKGHCHQMDNLHLARQSGTNKFAFGIAPLLVL